MTTKKDFIELGEWQLNAFKQRNKYKQALEEINENRQKLIKRYHQAIDESCYQDVRELGAMIEMLN